MNTWTSRGSTIWTAFNFTPWAVKQLESAARQFGKTKKAFGVVRRDGLADDVPGLQVHCKLADASGHQCALPASGVVYHAGGQAKRDYPGSFLHQATWYREHAALEAKLSRLGLLISQERRSAGRWCYIRSKASGTRSIPAG